MSGSVKDVIEFTLIFNRYKSKLYSYVLKMTNDIMLSEDIAQEVFLKFYEHMNRLNNPGAARYWLFTAARNEVYGIFRQKHSHVDQYNVADSDEIEIEDSTNPASEFEAKETRALIMNALDKMPPVQKEVFLLKEYGGFSYREIASIMNIDEALVKSRLFKVRQKLITEISRLVE